MNRHALIESVHGAAQTQPRIYSYRHTVSFEDTNVVGNVYFACYVSWQGRCRELFLRDYAPDVIDDLRSDLRLVTLSVSCEYFAELRVLDDVEIRMSLAHLRQHRIGLIFNYVLQRGHSETLVARGNQEVGCMRGTAGGLLPTAIPRSLAAALAQFAT